MVPPVAEGRFEPCPGRSNCVCSDDTEGPTAIAPFRLLVPAGEAWPVVVAQVRALPRTRIAREGDGYVHAVCRSLLFRFADDLELHLRAAPGLIAVRSSSRVGRTDLGVNRRRVERLRAALARLGVVAGE